MNTQYVATSIRFTEVPPKEMAVGPTCHFKHHFDRAFTIDAPQDLLINDSHIEKLPDGRAFLIQTHIAIKEIT